MDADGYATDAELEVVKHWPVASGWVPLMEFIGTTCWWAADWGWTGPIEDHEENATRYAISTGGWSGNESVITAMRENREFWHTCWYSMRRGGHYEIVVPLVKPT